jgi:hypothetical protein
MKPLQFTVTILLASFLFSCSKINSVTIENTPETVFKGDSLQLKAVVKGEGNPDTTVEWVILESVTKGTSVSKEGLLIVSENESTSNLTIKAIASKDTSKLALVSIKVNTDQKKLLGNWIVKASNDTRRLNLSNDLWVCKYSSGSSYNISDLKWTAIKNDDIATKDEYPDGYIITGTADKVFGVSKIIQGQMMRFKLLINNDYSKLLRVDMEADLGKRGTDILFTRDN